MIISSSLISEDKMSLNSNLAQAIADDQVSQGSATILMPSQKLASHLLTNAADPADATSSSGRVVLSLLIDVSPSMSWVQKDAKSGQPFNKADAVVKGQKLLLDSFGGTKGDLKDQLLIGQWLFDKEVHILNSYVPYDSPKLARLDRSGNYKPEKADSTAVWDTLASTITAQLAYVANIKGPGLGLQSVRSIIGIVSDGDDNMSKAFKTPEDLAPVVREMTDRYAVDKNDGILILYLGIDAEVDHNALARRLGLPADNTLNVDAAESEIRRQFELLSQRSVRG